MLQKRFAGLALLALLLSAGLPAVAEVLPPVVMVPKLASGTDVPSAIWSQLPAIPRYEHYTHDYMPTQQTDVRLAWDDSNLYVAFRCLDEKVANLSVTQTKRDSEVWKDDCVSLFLDPKHNHRNYYYLVANSLGTQYDEKDAANHPESWDGDWKVDVTKERAQWKVLVTLPFASMGVSAPRPGAVWGANFGRICTSSRERSGWVNIRPHLRDPDRWGSLVFAEGAAPIITSSTNNIDSQEEWSPVGTRAAGTCSAPSTPIGAPGHQPVTLTVSNPAGRDLALKADILCDGKPIERHLTTVGPGVTPWNMKIDFPFEGEHTLAVAVTDSAGRLLMRSAVVEVYITRNRKRLSLLQRLVNEVKPAALAAKDQKAALLRTLDGIAADIRRVDGDKQAWAKISRTLANAQKPIGCLRALCADPSGRGYALGVETALTKILRDELFEGVFNQPARVSAARNEYESVQVVVAAHDKPVKGVKVSVSDLKGPSGAVIPAREVELNLVDWVKTGWPRYAAEYAGWIPDPLMNLTTFDVPAGGVRPVWVTVHTPSSVPPGVYRGEVRVQPEGAPESTVPLEVRVWGFTLPVRGHMKTAFALFEGELNTWYGDVTPEMRREWYDFLLKRRINPTNIYSNTPVPWKEDIQFCVDRGMNAFTLACTWYKGENDRSAAELTALIKEYEAYLKPRGLWDLPYIYGFDEIDYRKFQELKDTYGWIGKKFPDLARMCTVKPTEDLKGYIDIWVPLTSHYIPEVAEEYRKQGDEVWMYVCCHPFHPWPNFFVDYPGIDPRVTFWMNWKYKSPGFLYYAMNLWETNRVGTGDNGHLHDDPEARKAIAAGKRWPEVSWNTFTCADFNGDGHLLYPGPGGHPIGSVRLECIRDGIEDYEYFYTLNELVKKAEKSGKTGRALLARARKLLEVRPDAVKSMTEYTLEPSVLLDARSEVAEMIQKLAPSP